MNEKYINEALCSIDAPAIGSALSYRRSRRRIKAAIAAGAAAAAVGIAALVYFGTAKAGSTVSTDAKDGGLTSEAFKSGGAAAGQDITSDAPVTYTGNAPSAEDIRSLIERDKNMIAAFVRSEYGEPLGEIQIALSGYSHLRTSDNTAALDFVTLPVLSDGNVIASVTVYSVDGELFQTVSAGGTGFERLNGIFAAHPGEQLCFVYAGQFMEAVIAPDDTVYTFTEGSDDPFGGEKGLYRKYSTPCNTFSLSEMLKRGDYITVGADEGLVDISGR